MNSQCGDEVDAAAPSGVSVTLEAVGPAAAAVTGSPHFFEVQLDLFDGPIDLLLHLVKKNELPIEKVSLADVTAQYLRCLELMEQFDLEVAGEYLVIAATLLSVKSSVLLNEPAKLEIDDDGNVFDPHEELLRRLREAQVYKEGAFHLSCRQLLGVDVFAPPSSLDSVERPPAKLRDHDAILLVKAFQRVLSRGGDQPLMTISFESISIVDRMMQTIDILRGRGGRASFSALVPDQMSRSSIVASFVALLELCKRSLITIAQNEAFEEIEIVLVSEQEHAAVFTSEFDAPAVAQDQQGGSTSKVASGG